MEQKKRCFVISPIGEDGSDVRKRADQIYDYVIKPVMETKLYEVTRSDHIPYPGKIPTQIIQRLLMDALVIADLTFANANVTYELGIRHMTGKPVIQIKDTGDGLPFDLFSWRTIDVDYRYISSMDKCRADITKQIEAIEKNPNLVHSPIPEVLQFAKLTTSDDPLKAIIPKLQTEIELIRAEISDIRKNMMPRPLVFAGPETTLSGISSGQVIYQQPSPVVLDKMKDLFSSPQPIDSIEKATIALNEIAASLPNLTKVKPLDENENKENQ